LKTRRAFSIPNRLHTTANRTASTKRLCVGVHTLYKYTRDNARESLVPLENGFIVRLIEKQKKKNPTTNRFLGSLNLRRIKRPALITPRVLRYRKDDVIYSFVFYSPVFSANTRYRYTYALKDSALVCHARVKVATAMRQLDGTTFDSNGVFAPSSTRRLMTGGRHCDYGFRDGTLRNIEVSSSLSQVTRSENLTQTKPLSIVFSPIRNTTKTTKDTRNPKTT